MPPFYFKKINKLLSGIVFSLIFFIPQFSLASDCTDDGGECIVKTSCMAWDSNYNADCDESHDMVCCKNIISQNECIDHGGTCINEANGCFGWIHQYDEACFGDKKCCYATVFDECFDNYNGTCTTEDACSVETTAPSGTCTDSNNPVCCKTVNTADMCSVHDGVCTTMDCEESLNEYDSDCNGGLHCCKSLKDTCLNAGGLCKNTCDTNPLSNPLANAYCNYMDPSAPLCCKKTCTDAEGTCLVADPNGSIIEGGAYDDTCDMGEECYAVKNCHDEGGECVTATSCSSIKAGSYSDCDISAGMACCEKNCNEAGGICINLDDCFLPLNSGAYDETCGFSEVCCDSEQTACAGAGGNCVDSGTCFAPLHDYDNSCELMEECCNTSIFPEYAAEYQEGSTGGFLLLKGHLVPCGRQSDDPGTENIETRECTLCHLFLLFKNIFDLMLSLLIVVSILAITIGGVVYMVSMGNQNLVGIAKNIIFETLKGFGLMMAGWLLVYTLLVFFSTGDMVGKGTDSWFEFTCNDKSIFGEETTPSNPTDPGNTVPGDTIPGDTSGYTYDDLGIKSQMADASVPLKNLLSCMKDNLPAEAKRISSISDSYGIDNCAPLVYVYGIDKCQHSRNSCHYGGRHCIGESYAVDFGNENYEDLIGTVAAECGASFIKKEATHTHVSVGAANNCGCN